VPSPSASRTRLRELVVAIPTHDELAAAHLSTVLSWIDRGEPLYRTVKPAVPPMHLVSYFVVEDPDTERMLFVEHRGAGLLLPPGGHVDPDEDPWQTVVREAQEELRLVARPRDTGRPAFLTVNRTRGPGAHTDVSLWYRIEARPSEITWYDGSEFGGIGWLDQDELRARPIATLDPHTHRFLDAISVAPRP
jgi:8-oxo-dGTP pyrophosphatase MutT (NUDIX family)